MNLSLVFDIAAILVGGFFAAHLASRFHIPKVTAYLLWGLMLGPLSGKLLAFLTGGAITEPIINSHELEALHVINELALGLILFGMGGELTSKRLRSLTGEIIKISCITSLLVYVAVGLGTYCAGIFLPGTSLPLSAAALMGAMAISTAPAATVLVINEYRASGRLTDVILGLTAVNVVLCLLAYKLSYAFILWHGAADLSIAALIPHLGSVIWYLGGSVVVGVGIGLLMSLLEQNRDEGSDELYIAYFACVILGIGICKFLGVTYLLALMVSGMVVLHSFFEGEEVFKRLKEVGKPLYLMFFVLSGAELQPDVLVLMGWVGVAYVVFRSIALWVGFYFSARWQGENKEVWKFGGTALLCHASLPLGLYMTLNQQDPHLALPIGTIVLSSVVVFELAGPILERWSLIQAGEIPVESIVHHQEKTLYRMGLIETVNYLM
ncbi:MAG: cation:proton antiporter [Candidatus Lindowbacteria bacterium]|nr:cation:proton antiporter [Candidatus Lindowbacteria bacterium]